MNEKPTESFASAVSRWVGSSMAFSLALALVIIWAVAGPFFNYSENWQMVINTSTTIITFLMVFLIQKAQNKESLAVQLKLNELIAATEAARNKLLTAERLTEKEMTDLSDQFAKLVDDNATDPPAHD